MKKVNKLLAAGAVLAFAVMGTAFAEGEFKFENELSTDTWIIGENFNDNRRFGGIEERMQGEYTSDKVDVNLNLSFIVVAENVVVAGEKRTRSNFYNWYINDSYIKFRPVDAFQLALADGYGREYASGSYMPVKDNKVSVGEYTGNFGLLFKPIEGLSIGAGIDFSSYFFSNVYDDDDQLVLNFGGEYEVENIGAFAVTFNNVVNNFSFGAYAKISAIQAADFYAGFSFKKERGTLLWNNYFSNGYSNYGNGIYGKLLLNAGFEYKGVDKLTLAADLATNLFTEANWSHDLYAGLKAEYDVNESFSIGGNMGMYFDLVDSNKTEYYDPRYDSDIYICPGVTYKLGNNTFKAGFTMEFNGDNFFGAIPLSWKYSF